MSNQFISIPEGRRAVVFAKGVTSYENRLAAVKRLPHFVTHLATVKRLTYFYNQFEIINKSDKID
jgi:hypothetical protein